MFGKKSVDTLVAGAGPTGMITALALARKGIDTTIVDTASRTCTTRSSLLIHPQTLRLFEKLGFVERIVEAGYRINNVLLYDDTQPRETVNLNALPIAFPYAISVPQCELEFILEDELANAGVKVLWDHRVSSLEHDEQGLYVEIDRYSDMGTGYAVSHTERVIDKTFHYQTKLMVAADGYNSLIRRFTHRKSAELGKDQYFVFFDFETDMDPKHSMRISIHDDLATAQYPMPGGIARMAFQFRGITLPSENRNKERDYLPEIQDTPAYLDDQHFKELIDKRVPWITGYINKIRYRAAVPFEKRYLTEPYAERIFFIGDAARQFGPLGSLSMNLGMLEGDLLADEYTNAHELGKELDIRLDELGKAMTYRWKALADIQSRTTPIEMSDPWIARNRARIIRSLPATGEVLERLASQIFIHLNLEELAKA